MALERLPKNITNHTRFGGYIGLGTLPPVGYEPDFVTVSVEITDAIPLSSYPNGTVEIVEWTLSIQAVSVGNYSNKTSFQATVDSGIFGLD